MPQAAAYSPDKIAQIRNWVRQCSTWDEARGILAQRLDIHPDNVTRMNRRHGFYTPPPAAPASQPTPSPAPTRRDLGIRNLHDSEFDASTDTSTAATLEQVVELLKVDIDVWEPKGFSITRRKTGFGWNARFAKRPEAANRKVVEDLKADLLARTSVVPLAPVKRKEVKGGRLFVPSLFDAHLGKLSWAEQDGQNYDLKIAKEVYARAAQDLLRKAQRTGPIGRILFAVGNDYLTCDSDANMTTAGTLQSVDGRYPKIYREGRKLLCETIEFYRQYAPVDVVVMPGNHDRNSMFHIGDALECWFRDCKDVTVDNRWTFRKYYAFGNTVLGFAHGDTINKDKLPLGGAVEEPELWARCKRRMWLLGHYHHELTKEIMGVKVTILPSLSGSDGYHQQHGYIGATRQAVGLVFSEEGHEATVYSEPEN